MKEFHYAGVISPPLLDPALDVPTERAVLRSVAEFHTHQTIIVISHRIRSLAWVDRFVLLDQGRIVATGTHSTLYAQSALYHALFDASAQDMIMPFKSEREDQVKDADSAEHKSDVPL